MRACTSVVERSVLSSGTSDEDHRLTITEAKQYDATEMLKAYKAIASGVAFTLLLWTLIAPASIALSRNAHGCKACANPVQQASTTRALHGHSCCPSPLASQVVPSAGAPCGQSCCSFHRLPEPGMAFLSSSNIELPYAAAASSPETRAGSPSVHRAATVHSPPACRAVLDLKSDLRI